MSGVFKRASERIASALRGASNPDDPTRPWLKVEVPTPVLRIPAFLSAEEKQYLLWLTENAYEGWGAIVDLGAWIGGSSCCLAEGLKRRGRTEKIQSFDLFRWERSSMGEASGLDLPEGSDFVPVFERYVRDHRRWIEPRKEDLTKFRWNEGPIEILFVDAAKNWDLTNAIFAGFGNGIVPERTRVVFQDFRFYGCWWLPLVIGARPDLWREVENVSDGCTVTLVTRKPLLGTGGLDANYSDDSFSLEESERVIRARMETENDANRVHLLRSLYKKALIEPPSDRVDVIREELFAAEGGPPEAKILAYLGDNAWHVSRDAWKAFETGDANRARTLAERILAARGPISYCLQLLGRICLQSGEFAASEQYLTRAIETSLAMSPYAALDRAELRRKLGRLDDAERDVLLYLEQVIGNEFQTQHGIWALEKIWQDAAPPDRGFSVLQKLAAGREQSAAIWAALARVEHSLGRRDDALAHLGAATTLDPENPLVRRCREEMGLDGGPPKP